MAYPKPAFKRVKLHTPYLIRYEHDCELSLVSDAGHYLFRAVIEFRRYSLGAVRSIRVVAVENTLRQLTPLAESWYLGAPGTGGYGFLRDVQLKNLRSVQLFPLEHLPLLLSWEKRYPRFDELLGEVGAKLTTPATT